MTHLFRVAATLWFLIAGVPALALAQSQSTAADVEGTITDETDARVPGATVTIVNVETGLRVVVPTDAEGRYSAHALPVGTYALTVTAAGFAPSDPVTVTLPLGSVTVRDLRLTVRGQEYFVEVTRDRAVTDAQRPGLGAVVPREEFDELPVAVRNFLAFSLLVPGSAQDRTPQQGASRTSGLVFSGQRARSNNIRVDGLDNNDQVVGSVRAGFSQEAVEAFQVLANGFSAEFGEASAGVVNIITRSGTNTARGSAFVFGRDAALDAKNYFERFTPAGAPIDRDKAPYQQYEFGGTFSGPIRRDRTFAIASIERLTADASNFVTIDGTTPIPHPLIPGQTLGTAVDILRAAGFAVETGHVPYRLRSTQWLFKLDHLLTPAQRVAVRINGASELNENIEPFGGLVARSRGARLDNTDFMIAATHTTGGQRVINDARVLIARRDQTVESLDPRCGGRCDAETEGGPTLEIAGVASVGRHRFTPTPRDDTRYEFVDTLSYTRQRHTLKAGADGDIIIGRRQALPLHFGGRYIFAALPAIPPLLPAPVSSIQAVALGLPAAYVQGYGESSVLYNTGTIAAFVEDVWTPRPALSMRYGLRYQRQHWPGVSYRVPGIAQPYGFPSDNNNLAPRLAISWSPDVRTTTLRGGYGVYYDNIITAPVGVAARVTGQSDGIRTLVLTAPAAFAAWAAPDHRLPEATAKQLTGGSFPSVVIAIDPGLKTSYAHHAFVGLERQLPRALTASVTASIARGRNQLGTIDYNPIVPALGRGRRPLDVNGVAGTSASVLQYTSFGESWYRAVTVGIEGRPLTRTVARAFYTLSTAEDTATDFQSAFLPQDNGAGRDPANPAGLPAGFRPRSERGPALQDQRHRLVMTGTSELAGHVTLGVTLGIASGWPYNILAGADLNGDGDGGTFPSDRARRNPVDPASAVERNAGRLPVQANVDLRIGRPIHTATLVVEPMLDVLNLLNRANFTDVQSVFGTGAYPAQPSVSYGQFTQAAPGRQIQLGVRMLF